MDGATPTRWVVVGVDGSDSSRHALEWSAHQASLRGLGVRIVAGAGPLASVGAFGRNTRAEPWDENEKETGGADKLLDYAADWVGRLFPELEIRTTLSHERPVDALLAETEVEGAAVVVIGSRGLSAVMAALVRSVGIELAARSPIPVVVLPHEHAAAHGVRSRVIVGVDRRAHV